VNLAAIARRVVGWIGLFGFVWLAAIGAVWMGQEKLIFRPDRLAADHRFDVPPDVHEDWIDVPGARLNALHLRLPDPRGVVFYLHGNGGSLASWWINAEFYRRLNLDLYMIDYRGYGKSSGRNQSEAQLHADVRAAWDHVAPRYAGRTRVIFGRSMGSGLAAHLAAELQPELTVLVTPYTSMIQLAREHYAWVPIALLRYPLRTDAALARVKTPVFIAHGTEDTLIDPSHARALARIAPQVELLIVPGARHGDLHRFPDYLNRLSAALGRAR
jgi:pimeloyl-ACP methyl ester carboxylesterase